MPPAWEGDSHFNANHSPFSTRPLPSAFPAPPASCSTQVLPFTRCPKLPACPSTPRSVRIPLKQWEGQTFQGEDPEFGSVCNTGVNSCEVCSLLSFEIWRSFISIDPYSACDFFFSFSGASVARGIKRCFIALCRCLHSPGLLMMAHSDHPRNTYSSHFFFGVGRMLYSAGCNGSQAVPNGHCGTTQRRQA